MKEKPLRNPGQSVDEEMRDLITDYFFGPCLFAFLLLVFAGTEWWRYLRPYAPSPWLYSVTAALAVGWAGYRLFRVWPRWHALRLARDGERHVGQSLEELRGRGYKIFHDIVGDGFKLDHVLIGPAGIFTVETKTHSKSSSGARIVFDGETILEDGFTPDRDPVVQARAQASWLRELLVRSTGRKLDVRPVIVYPGWFVEYKGPEKRTIWVLNPKAVPTFLDHEPPVLTPEEIQLASFHLSRFIRAT